MFPLDINISFLPVNICHPYTKMLLQGPFFALNRVQEEAHVTTELKKNGYSLAMISKMSPRLSQEGSQPVVLPYMIMRHVSERIRRLLPPLNVRTCFKPLRQLLVHPRSRGNEPQRTGVIYKIP